MKPVKKNCFIRKGAWPFLLFWLIGTLVFIGRLAFDVKTYSEGSTLCYRYVSNSGYDYLLHLPKGYTDFDGPRPLIIYLHGAGETGISLAKLRQRDLAYQIKGKIDVKDFPFIVVCPVTPRHGWEPEQVVQLLDDLLHDKEKRWRIDEKRIYLTGFSMGAFGAFRAACKFPERFAAIAPVAGGGEPENAAKLRSLPTWAFHGDADNVVPYECSSKMIEAMREAGCREARLTTMEGRGHGIAHHVYSDKELYRWLFDKTK